MMHQSARKKLFPLTRQKRIGTMLMFAVRSIFAKPERVVAALREAAAQGKIDKSIGESAEPLGFLIHDSGAANITEAAYRFARHEPGVDVVLFGTGDAGASARATSPRCCKPPLPEADRAKLATLFGATDRRRNGFRADADQVDRDSAGQFVVVGVSEVVGLGVGGVAFSTPACVSAAPTCCMRLINSTAAIGVSTMRCAG